VALWRALAHLPLRGQHKLWQAGLKILTLPHLFPDYPALKEVGAGTWNRVAASIKPAATREVYSITFAAAARIPATAKRACCAAILGTRTTKSG